MNGGKEEKIWGGRLEEDVISLVWEDVLQVIIVAFYEGIVL